jgi:hypothetical protein
MNKFEVPGIRLRFDRLAPSSCAGFDVAGRQRLSLYGSEPTACNRQFQTLLLLANDALLPLSTPGVFGSVFPAQRIPKGETVVTETLVVVGNAEPRKDYSEFIDKCDVVVRFNFTPFFDTHRTGQRTTILCLFGVPYPCGGEVPRLNGNIVKNCQTIWVQIPAFCDPLMKGYDIPREKIAVMDLHALHDDYATSDAERIRRPSSGFQVLRYLVNSSEFAGYRRLICGFEWRGGGHDWETEKRQAARYIELGLIKSLDGRDVAL